MISEQQQSETALAGRLLFSHFLGVSASVVCGVVWCGARADACMSADTNGEAGTLLPRFPRWLHREQRVRACLLLLLLGTSGAGKKRKEAHPHSCRHGRVVGVPLHYGEADLAHA
jgi:hypothetical protein